MQDATFFYARTQMAYSLAFHIIFAAVGIAMPLLMAIAELVGHRRRDPEWIHLARQWSKGTAVFFAVGAVSGTVLSFELGLLFPKFMEVAGPLIGFPFALEGFAFFTEAIFLGIYLYGWDRVRPALHVFSGFVVAGSGLLSAVFVTLVNAWMNSPAGFRIENGTFTDIDPVRAMFTPFAMHEVIHTVLACYASACMAVAGIHAVVLLKNPRSTLHWKALGLALAVMIPSALLQPIVGHRAGKMIAQLQPAKLAAMEGLEETTARAPLRIGPVAIPGALSWLAYGDPDALVRGLRDFPADERPPSIVRYAFLTMVGIGFLLAAYSLYTLIVWLKEGSLPTRRAWLWTTAAFGPTGVIAMEAGWIVTEVGRQPWIIYGVMRSREAVTSFEDLAPGFLLFALVYVGLGFVVLHVLRHQIRASAPRDLYRSPSANPARSARGE